MKSKVRTIRIVRQGHMDWFSGQAPRAKESLDKGGEEDRKMGACFCSCSCLFVRFPLLFVLSVRARCSLGFSCVLGHASKLVFARKWKGVSTENNVLHFRSGNTFLY